MDGLNYFMPGQVWKYDTRPGEENSTVTILAIDEHDEHAIIHIRIDQVVISGDGKPGYLPHLPFSDDAVLNSVTDFLGHLEAVPDFKEGYDHWKREYDAGKAGCWSIPVKEVVDAIEQVMKNRPNE
jgi:hypothetical protein